MEKNKSAKNDTRKEKVKKMSPDKHCPEEQVELQSEPPALKVVNLEDKITVENVKRLKTDLLEHLSSHDKIWINFSRAAVIDLAGIQLLYSARRYALNQGKELMFTGTVPENVMQGLLVGGFIKMPLTEGKQLTDSLIDFPQNRTKTTNKENADD